MTHPRQSEPACVDQCAEVAAELRRRRDLFRQAALELNAEIRNGLAWIGSGNPDFIAHNAMRSTADKWRYLLEDEE